nr:YhjD/YihY/BrkB family envelope integrity protein [Kineosporia babensis]
MAAEVGFFALLSLPPLVLGLVGSIGFVGDLMGAEAVADLRGRLRELTLTFLTAESVSSVILPTFDQVVGAGRADIVSIGFVLSLWSGSRVLNVYLDTVSIMYGLGGLRGIVRTRVLSFSLYCLALIVGIVVIPLVLIGPGWLSRVLYGAGWDTLGDIGGSDWVYWPVVSFATVAGIAGLYHLSTPIRSRWYRDVPGAVLALTIWVLTSFVLRWALNESVGGTSIYGPLATPIVVLIWLYFLAIAVLIGAALNAAIDERWPTPARVEARARVRERHEAAVAGLPASSGKPAKTDEQPETLTPLAPRPPFAHPVSTQEPLPEPETKPNPTIQASRSSVAGSAVAGSASVDHSADEPDPRYPAPLPPPDAP